ncbi:MAG: ABC transporter substrate-binding protein [Actinobacteria bacterium]|nr:ABC transporter substrate-binding protein [Actinomycetota bacterium]
MKKIAAFIALLALTGCATSQTHATHSISQNDVTAIAIDTSTKFSVKKVVVLANGVAEIITALNGKSIIVGRDISSSEKELADISIVTSGHQILPEKVIALKPDLVIVDASAGPTSAIAQIKSAGITVVQTPESWNLTDISTKVSAVAAAIGAPEQGQLLNNAISAQITLPTQPKIAFLYLRGTSAIYLIGGAGSGADSLISAIGAVDVGAAQLPRPFNTLTAESLASLNPDIILVMTKGLESVGGISGLVKLPGVAQTNAGKNHAVIDVDDSLLLSFGPRTPSLVQALSAAVKAVMK